jgi:glycosyltransferase involved in cell wall biosynthesis
VVDAAFVIPGDINLPTGGYSYDRRVLALLPQYGVRTSHVVLPGSFPTPSGADMAETERRLAAVPQGTILLIDGLAYGAMSSEAVARIRSPIVALVHHPLCLEAGLTPQRQRRLRELEAAALTFARHVVVTSPTTAQTLAADFGVPREKITVAVPGTDPAQRACGTSKPLQLLAVGSIVPRKAFHILVRALGPLKDRDWRLSIVGPANRDSEALGALEAAIADTGLASRITLVGPVDADSLAGHYATADLFVMPSLYEGYGMVLAEALARGLAIVCTTGGAAAETVPDDAAIKVAPGDERALSQAIGRMLDDAALRRRLADAAWAGGQKLPRWQDTARIVAGVIKDIALMSTPVSAT